MKKTFLKDIAKDLGVSKTTVSFVMNDMGDKMKISKDTQEKIKKYAEEKNYVPNQLARGLSTGKSKSIGLIIPNISDSFYAEIAGEIEKEAEKNGYTVIYSSTYENPKRERELITSMLNRQIDGLIIASTQKNSKEILSLKKDGFPFVLIDRYYPKNSTNQVIVDNYEGVQKATQHLIDLNRKKLAFITLSIPLEALQERLRAFQETMVANQLSIAPAQIIKFKQNQYQVKMHQKIRYLADEGVDAIIFATHYLAALGLRELKALNIAIPNEIAIISFDEMDAFDLIEPPITSIQQPVHDIGVQSVKVLLNQLENMSVKLTQKIVLKTELIVRKSCGA